MEKLICPHCGNDDPDMFGFSHKIQIPEIILDSSIEKLSREEMLDALERHFTDLRDYGLDDGIGIEWSKISCFECGESFDKEQK